jgi:gliding motility-associated-like protein
MKRYFILVFFLLAFAKFGLATHQRAAEITYKHIEGLTYQFTVTMYTRTSSPADDYRDSIPIVWGDGSVEMIPRIDFYPLGNDISFNRYVGNHTYAGPGAYTISVEDPNRNNGVVNIPNSVNVPMFIDSYLVINPFLGYNNSVKLLNSPIDEGCVGKPFYHNPGAFDEDGDSLSYKLVVCKGANGKDIPGYSFPKTSNLFLIDSVTGDLIWENPILQGEYNVAFLTQEWRQGILIGYVRRDMQITIVSCANEPPVIGPLHDTCVQAGDTLRFSVSAFDPDSSNLSLTAFGGPFEQSVSPAYIYPDPAEGKDEVSATFVWPTNCSHVKKGAYSVGFKVKDSGFPIGLATFENILIKVVAPAPDNLQAQALGNGIDLHWNQSVCSNAVGYRVYRRNDSVDWQHGNCETGVPAYTGFRLVGTLSGRNDTVFRDDEQGAGLVSGQKYCYRVIAFFADGAESYASHQVCAALKRDVALITHVSNLWTTPAKGYAFVDWAKPNELDTLQFPPPYVYKLYRGDGYHLNNPQLIGTFQGGADTVFVDSAVNLNAMHTAVSYQVDMASASAGFIGSSQLASSIFLSIQPADKRLRLSWNANTPWRNMRYVVYRKNLKTHIFDSIAETTQTFYQDNALENDQNYCYLIKSVGGYTIQGLVNPIINYSQIACAVPNDVVAPCAPNDTVSTNCNEVENTLKIWMPLADSCYNDLKTYFVYYAAPGAKLSLIDSVDGDHADTVYYLHHDISSVVGCYAAQAVDSVGNISEMSPVVCVNYDACPQYELPNVFTPNGDGVNDLLTPMHALSDNPKSTVDHIDMVILNRWGRVVFSTHEPMINWDGKNQFSHKDCPDGVYFYTCEVFYAGTEGLQKQHLQGSISIRRGR